MLDFKKLSFSTRSRIAEISLLVFLSVLSPLVVGLEIFSQQSFVWSLVLLNVLNLPAIILFYRVFLPYTVGKGRFLLAALLSPVYFMLYELNTRLSAIVMMHLPFVPEGYRKNLSYGNPQDFSHFFIYQTIGYTSLVLLAVTSLYFIRRLYQNLERTVQLENQNLTLELNHLKTQLHPHFFFNTLNNLYAMSVQGSSQTPAMIKDLSTIMRYVLYEASAGKVQLRQEVDFIKSYIDLENIRHREGNLIELAVQGAIDNIMIEPLLFLPLLENTFKHAVRKASGDKDVEAILSVDDDEIVFQTSNAINYNVAVTSGNHQGIGLLNLRKRLDLVYPGAHELTILEEQEQFIVTLTIKRK